MLLLDWQEKSRGDLVRKKESGRADLEKLYIVGNLPLYVGLYVLNTQLNRKIHKSCQRRNVNIITYYRKCAR